MKKKVNLAAAIQTLAESMPARSSLVQAAGILQIAEAHFTGREITLGEVWVDKSNTGAKPSVSRVYASLLPPEDERNPDALGWIEIYTKPADLRKKYVRLTKKGEAEVSHVYEVAVK